MWSRSELKERGKMAFKANYGKCVLTSLILGFVTSAGGNIGSRSSSDVSAEDFSEAIEYFDISPEMLMGIVVAILGVAVVIIIFSSLINLFLKNVLQVGCNNFFLLNATDSSTKVSVILDAFKNNYINTVLTMFMSRLFIGLWSLLFIIPGIIKAYEYMMVPYILSENPDINWKEALDESKMMMDGHKWNTFVLQLSFIGWHILSILTCGILEIFWTIPYQNATMAELYYELRDAR